MKLFRRKPPAPPKVSLMPPPGEGWTYLGKLDAPYPPDLPGFLYETSAGGHRWGMEPVFEVGLKCPKCGEDRDPEQVAYDWDAGTPDPMLCDKCANREEDGSEVLE